MIVMFSQIPYRSFNVTSGNVYVADQYGIIPNVASQADQLDLASAGCSTLSPNPTDLLGYIIGANFNSTADQIVGNLNSSYKFRVRRITVTNTSVNGMGTAVGGLYTGAGKTGTVLVAATQAYTGLTNPTTADDLTLNSPNAVLVAGTKIYLSLTTPQGAPATADVYVYGDAIPVT